VVDGPSSYLVLASQRSGSTPLVESLRATGAAGELAAEEITPIEVAYPMLWRKLTEIVGAMPGALGLDRSLAAHPVLERQAENVGLAV
jgi:LPS sulfotransferase NodH